VCYLGAKVALVIANNQYEHLPSLETPTSVVLVATKLIKMGFKVLLYLNTTAEEMGNAATTFRKICKEAQTALFFLVATAVALMARQCWRPSILNMMGK
jgi:uncharacterized caspase-like protein